MDDKSIAEILGRLSRIELKLDRLESMVFVRGYIDVEASLCEEQKRSILYRLPSLIVCSFNRMLWQQLPQLDRHAFVEQDFCHLSLLLTLWCEIAPEPQWRHLAKQSGNTQGTPQACSCPPNTRKAYRQAPSYPQTQEFLPEFPGRS